MKAPSTQTLSTALLGAALLPLATMASVAACASEAEPTPQDEGTYENYLDAPQTPGTWTYEDEPSESLGLFGIPDPAHPFVIRCDKTSKRIGLARSTQREGPLTMVLRAETTTRQMVAQTVEGYGLVAVDLDPNDPLLDAMAITKGRFVVELEGEETLYIPAWTEFSRVVEDCR